MYSMFLLYFSLFVYLPFFSYIMYMAKPRGQTDFRHSAVNEVASMQQF